jgi:hypothetical protein
MLNLGIDFGLIKDALYGSLEYYHRKGTDLIGYSPFAPSTGISNLQGNFANMAGHGVDIKFSSNIINRKFKWTSTILLSWATDKVTKYTGTEVVPSNVVGATQNISPVVGKPVYAVYSLKAAPLDSAGNPQGYDKKGNLTEDYPTLTTPDSMNQLQYNGPARPQIFGGLNNRFIYKNFGIAFNISYKLKYYFFRSSINYANLFNNYVGNKDYEKRWQKPGDEKLTNVPSIIYPDNSTRDYFYQVSSVLVERGDHIRFQDISLSYDFDKSNFTWLPMRHIQFYAYANNVGILWRASHQHLDPDYPTGGIPAPRSFSFGLRAGF